MRANSVPVAAVRNAISLAWSAGRPGVAHDLHDPETAEHLHRARRDVVAFHARHLTRRIALGDDDVDAARRKIERQRRADRPAADDQNLCAHHGHITLTNAC